MNRIRFNRPFPVSPLATVLDEFFTKGVNELAKSDFSLTKPQVNIIEGDASFSLELAAPGLKKEDFEIKLDKDQLMIKVVQKAEKETENEGPNFRRREFNYSSFKRSFHLPDTIDTSGIDASYLDGILTIKLAKKEEAKEKEPRTIAIS